VRERPVAKPPAETVAAWGLRLAVALGLGVAVCQLLVYELGLSSRLLDSSTDASLAGVLSAVMLGAAAAAAWAVALWLRSAPTLFVAAAFTLILVLELSDPPHRVLLAAPLGAAAVFLVWRLSREDEVAGPLLRAGCAVLAVAFVGHAFGSWLVDRLDQGPHSALYQLKVVVKHGGELAAWTLLAAGLAALRLGKPLEEHARELGGRADEPEAQLVLVHELRERP